MSSKSVQIKDLTPPQLRLYRVAQAYVRKWIAFKDEDYYYRSTGDPAGMYRADAELGRARTKLLNTIANTHIVDPLE